MAQEAQQWVDGVKLHQQVVEIRHRRDYMHFLDDVIQVQLWLHKPDQKQKENVLPDAFDSAQILHINLQRNKVYDSEVNQNASLVMVLLLWIVWKLYPQLLVFVWPFLKGQNHFLHWTLVNRLCLFD